MGVHMSTTALESRLANAESLYDRLVHRNGGFIVTDNSGLRGRVVLPASMVKHQPTGFIREIDALRSDLMHLAKRREHKPPKWLSVYAFNQAGYHPTEADGESALFAAANNLGTQP